MNIQQTISAIQSCEEAVILAKEQIKNYEELIRSLQNRMYTEFIESDEVNLKYTRGNPWRPIGSKGGSEWHIHHSHCPLKFDDDGNVTEVLVTRHTGRTLPVKPKWVSINEWEPVRIGERKK